MVILKFKHTRGSTVVTVCRNEIVEVVDVSADGRQFGWLNLENCYGPTFDLAKWFRLKIGKGWALDRVWMVAT